MTLRGNSQARLVSTDEFNVSVPQEIGLIEAMTMGSAVYHVVSAQNGAPVMGCVQNTLTMAGICTNTFDTPRNAGDPSTTTLPDGAKGYEILISGKWTSLISKIILCCKTLK